MSLAFIVPERNTLKLEVSCIIQESFDVQRRSSFHLKEFHTYPASLCIAGSISSFDCRKVDFYFFVRHKQEIQLLCLTGLVAFHLSSFTFISFLRICHSKIWNLLFSSKFEKFWTRWKEEGTEIKTYMFMLRKRIQFNTILQPCNLGPEM